MCDYLTARCRVSVLLNIRHVLFACSTHPFIITTYSFSSSLRPLLYSQMYCALHVLLLSLVQYLVIYSVEDAAALVYAVENTNHQQMHKESFIINRNTLLHVSTLLGHIQGELFLLSLR
jgi:hypothetical protein